MYTIVNVIFKNKDLFNLELIKVLKMCQIWFDSVNLLTIIKKLLIKDNGNLQEKMSVENVVKRSCLLENIINFKKDNRSIFNVLIF